MVNIVNRRYKKKRKKKRYGTRVKDLGEFPSKTGICEWWEALP